MHKARVAGLEWDEIEWLNGSLASLLAQPGEPLKLRYGRGTNPGEVAACEFCSALRIGEFEIRERIGRPTHVFVALLVEASIHGNPPDLAFGLQPSEGDWQGRDHTFLLALFTEVARRGTYGITNLSRIERPVPQRRHHRLAEFFDLLVRDAEIARGVHFWFAEWLPNLEPQRKIRCRQDIRTAASRRQLVDFGRCYRSVDRFAREAGT